MKKTDLPADQQFFADLFSGLVLNDAYGLPANHSPCPPAAYVSTSPGWISSCAENTVINWKKRSIG